MRRVKKSAWLLMCCGLASVPHVRAEWVRTMPDQADSQQVDTGTLELSEGEWRAWTRSPFVIARDFPAGTRLPEVGVTETRMGVRCNAHGIVMRALALRLRDGDGRVIHEEAEPSSLAERLPPVTVGYGSSTPRLICAAGLSRQLGRTLRWPVGAAEVREWVDTLE
ncbi:hypothetical protein [Pseudoxanthomonas sp. PXM01]|uniref:hypothetical protein n=1 Tax=Pseudoxanthomonas sp. PXM01 TaxID=2769295 RepID=UPI00177F7056|nr:hypothetical protein [Pseudoxanthomonas sp. PXM01]MBD9469987.1 hypothetical protein [Pseudoxanthomonas sp. PXM01]